MMNLPVATTVGTSAMVRRERREHPHMRVFVAVVVLVAAATFAPFEPLLSVGILYSAFLMLGLKWPGLGLLTVGLMTVFDGAMRKWFLPGASNYVYLAKDILLIAAYFGAWLQGWWRHESGPQRRLRIIWAVLASLVLADVWMLRSGELYIALNGARMYLVYLPIAWLLPRYLRRFPLETLRRGVSLVVLLAVPMAALATVQYMSPRTSVINRYVGDSADAAVFGGESNVRSTGTFSYITGLTDFAVFVGCLATGLLVGGSAPVMAPLGYVAALWCGLCSGSRLAVVWLVVQSLLTIMLSIKTLHVQRAARLIGVLLLLSVALGMLAARYGTVDAVAYRAERAGDTSARVLGMLARPLNSIGITGFFGEGVGTAYQQLLRWQALPTAALAKYEEVSDDRFMLELGYPGLLIELALRLVSLLACWKWFRGSQSSQTRVIIAGILSYQVMFLWSFPLYNAVASIYYSASLGLACALYLSERRSWPQNTQV
jgi:hypothetical protein